MWGCVEDWTGTGRDALWHSGQAQGQLSRPLGCHTTDGGSQEPRMANKGIPAGGGDNTYISSHLPGTVGVWTSAQHKCGEGRGRVEASTGREAQVKAEQKREETLDQPST